MRKPIIAGNWKLHKTRAEARESISMLLPLIADRDDVEVVVCPAYTALETVASAVAGSHVMLGAQDVFWKESGAYTSQVSPGMLADLGVQCVIVGHSECRGRFGVPEPDFDGAILLHFGDTDESVNRKLKAALAAGITPICCVGETIGERRAGLTDDKVGTQTEFALAGVAATDAPGVVFAYEPVWAIGTGEVCGAAEADRVCGVIRATIARLYSWEAAGFVRIQYGGSVKPDNAAEILSQANIDGALVGGASLKASDFAAIVNACSAA